VCLLVLSDDLLGITSDNSEDVEWCVTTSRFEKDAREAARKMFSLFKPIGVGEGSEAAGIGLLSVDKAEEIILEHAGWL